MPSQLNHQTTRGHVPVAISTVRETLKMKPIIFTGLLLISLLIASCAPSRDFNTNLNSIVKSHIFSIVKWEARTLPQELNQWIIDRQEKIDDEISVVTEYFTYTERIKALRSEIEAAKAGNGETELTSLEHELNSLQEQKTTLASTVERIIEKQIRATLTQQGIFNPIIDLRVNFPPVNFKLAKPPHLLVISPRDRIESMREITLEPKLTLEEMEDIEASVDELDVSSLVLGLSGLGATYPTFVADEVSLKSTIETTAEEWLHQYLAFKPLGFLYLLDLTGLSRNYDIATMNETLAGMVSTEVGSIVYEKYYSKFEDGAKQNQKEAETKFNFNREMREIRKTVDSYLAQGEIERAEEFMEQKRQYLASKGYYIKKLNQAYFAFYGTYADRPAFISPIGLELKQIRGQSVSLKDFLNTVAAMTSHQELTENIK